MSDPLRRFEAEHEEALAALARLQHAAMAVGAGTPPAAHLRTMGEVLGFLRGAVRDHNEAEERALFPFISHDAPVAPFLDEHQALWGLERELETALERGDADRGAALSLEIVDLLRAHIQRENEVLFPLARALLGPAGLLAVARRLEG
ncbi:MAG TPA: hemerythrin domain-containing protein [Gemmatimonadales bacterium]|nr:hemerythrin domain-containing protein [Gemmatimonadales bacterium]